MRLFALLLSALIRRKRFRAPGRRWISSVASLTVLSLIIMPHVLSAQIWTPPKNLVSSIYSLAVDGEGIGWVSQIDEIKTSSDALVWESVLEYPASPTSIFVDSSRVYVAGEGLHIFDADSVTRSLEGIGSFSVYADGERILVGGHSGQLFESLDGGQKWEIINVPRLTISDRPIWSAAFLDEAVAFIQTNESNRRGLYARTGGSWVEHPTFRPQRIIVFEGQFLMRVLETVYSSRDGVAWEPYLTLPESGPGDHTWTMNHEVVVALARHGTFASFDRGATWEDLSFGLRNSTKIEFLALGPNGYLWAADGFHVQRTLAPLATSTRADHDLPVTSSIEAPYPNPSAGEVRLAVTSSGGPAEVSVYDPLGRRVATLVRGQVPPGTSVLTWDPSEVRSGLYFIVADIGGLRHASTVSITR